MRIRLFTVEEANRLLPDLRPRLERLRAQQVEIDRLGARIAVLDLASAGASAENPDVLEMRSLAEKRRRLGAVIGRGLHSLAESGVIVQDLARGLCDFHSLRGDRLVLLCWHLGEPEVGHWHPLEGGFAARRPLKGVESDG